MTKQDRCNYSSLTLQDLIELVARHYAHNIYTYSSIHTLTLGVVEEVGELAEQILLQHSPGFIPNKPKELTPIEEEIADIIVYCLAICVKLNVKPSFRNLPES